MNQKNQKVLVIDDEPDILELLDLTLSRMGLVVTTAENLAEARRALHDEEFSFCLTDMRLPDGNGLDLVEEIVEKYPDLPTAMITAHGKVEDAVYALKLGAFDFVSKPVDLAVLRKLVNTALKLRQDSAQDTGGSGSAAPGKAPENKLDRLIGSSAAMNQCKTMIAKLARSQAPVYISGESGTGKELAARMIHDLGPRAEGPFIAVNCGAIPAELMESELFGHRKGSFTGAVRDKPGLFQAANGGTLLLDEVGELPLLMQVKLLRAIQEKAIRPVGSEREQRVDVRILSATHKDLARLVADGAFRQDLFYRINVIELPIPPLREHPDDIPQLAGHILDRLANDGVTPPVTLADEARQALLGYAYRGNVRELENILERAAALCEDGTIRKEDLGLGDQGGANLPGADAPQPDVDKSRRTGDPVLPPDDLPLPKYLEEIERQRIVAALEKTRWNRTAAAELLGVSFRTLRYRLKKLEIE